MLTKRPTAEIIKEWERIFQENRNALMPNRRTGAEVDEYFRKKYGYEVLDSEKMREIVEYNIMHSNHNKEKLPEGMLPIINLYKVKDSDVIVGIDSVTGFFQVEGKDTEKLEEIFDDLFAFRGLDAMDIENYFLVAQYIECTNK